MSSCPFPALSGSCPFRRRMGCKDWASCEMEFCIAVIDCKSWFSIPSFQPLPPTFRETICHAMCPKPELFSEKLRENNFRNVVTRLSPNNLSERTPRQAMPTSRRGGSLKTSCCLRRRASAHLSERVTFRCSCRAQNFGEFLWGWNILGFVPACLPHTLGYACVLYAPSLRLSGNILVTTTKIFRKTLRYNSEAYCDTNGRRDANGRSTDSISIS